MALKLRTIHHSFELRDWHTFVKSDLLCIVGKTHGHKIYEDGYCLMISNITITESGDHFNIGAGHGENHYYVLAKKETRNKNYNEP